MPADRSIPPIPDEAVEAALEASAARELVWRGHIFKSERRDIMRAALTAAAPLLAGWRKLEGEPDPTKAPWDGEPVDLWDTDLQAREPMMCFDGYYFVNQDETVRSSWRGFSHYIRVPRPPVEGTP